MKNQPNDRYTMIQSMRIILGKIEVRGPVNGHYLDLIDQGLATLAEGMKEEEKHADAHNQQGENL